MKIKVIEVMDYTYEDIIIPYTLEELKDIINNKRYIEFDYCGKKILLNTDYIVSIGL